MTVYESYEFFAWLKFSQDKTFRSIKRDRMFRFGRITLQSEIECRFN